MVSPAASPFKVEEIRLLDCEFITNEDFSNDEIKLEIGTEIDISVSENNPKARIYLSLNVFEKDRFEDYPFFIRIRMKGIFSWEDSIVEPMLGKLLKENAPAVLLSYIRPFVSQFTAYAHYPPLILPLLSFKNPDNESE